ncbi:pseudouridine synthase [Aquabacterium fontiphilum]|jgi:23S rRNA pseudouridine2604 synthase|uniref:pseudouridine synthase n=1 Tax=Aquabacterium fontiphilum TaxID=450365 RepID=UPI001377B4CD|nr:pseudouridine synthase [Aquabacterium fontiphilum]
MTERKKIGLPARPHPDEAGEAPRRHAPVRGVAPRKRMTAAEAEEARQARQARAAEQAQHAERAAPDGRWTERPERQARHERHERREPDRRTSERQRPPVAEQRAPRPAPRPAPAPVEAREPVDHDGRVRLSKLMSERGLASRREADTWIEQGWVRVDGEVVSELGARIYPHQQITVDRAAREEQAQRVTILLHKPIGYVSGQAEDGHDPAVVLLTPENRWKEDKTPIRYSRAHLRKLAPAGRLDIDSTGLLVFTQDGRVARELIGEDSDIEKEYLVRVQWLAEPEAENVSAVVPEEVIEQMRHGLELDGRQLKPAKVSWQNEHQLRVVLKEGRKRQIRRMCELVGLKVVGLKRVRMGRIPLGRLPMGQWRYLRPDERF